MEVFGNMSLDIFPNSSSYVFGNMCELTTIPACTKFHMRVRSTCKSFAILPALMLLPVEFRQGTVQ